MSTEIRFHLHALRMNMIYVSSIIVIVIAIKLNISGTNLIRIINKLRLKGFEREYLFPLETL